MKVLLFAAKIADQTFPHRAHGYVFQAKSLVPPRPMFWSFTDVREEVGWYINAVPAKG